MSPEDYYTCPICKRRHLKERMTWHHLFPSINGREKRDPAIYVCQTCHDVIHYCHDNHELYFKYNSLETIVESNSIIELLNLYKYKAYDKVFKIKRLKKLLEKEYRNEHRRIP